MYTSPIKVSETSSKNESLKYRVTFTLNLTLNKTHSAVSIGVILNQDLGTEVLSRGIFLLIFVSKKLRDQYIEA